MIQKKLKRVGELIVNVDRQLEGTLEDWPAEVQDGVYKALERLAGRTKDSFTIEVSYAGYDIDTGPYIHVIACCSETIQ
jgi:hypothetical protein